ncbi:MAG TPA: FtsX-like permease family protein [Stellaceae bacterium]|jgi:putative ABC transport system permease protein|nr:FtsX-like permease family protein [Stellaceae bacterium]
MIRYALILATRELRGGIRGFRVFLACLFVGVAAIAAIGSMNASVVAGIGTNARVILGGDVAARLSYRPATPDELVFLRESGRLSRIVTMRAMARSLDGARHSLIELKAVDAAYPLTGSLTLQPPQTPAEALADNGAAVDPELAERLGLKPGDKFKIGAATVTLRATIAREPNAAFGELPLGPHVTISETAFAETKLIQPGAIVAYDYRLVLPPGTDPQQWTETARNKFPDAGWRLRTAHDAVPDLRRFFDRIGLFLNLVGVTALLVGGIGIGNAVSGYVAGKTQAIATLKCLGAPARLVFAAYLAQVLTLALAAIAAALLSGALIPAGASRLLAGVLPVRMRLGIYPEPLAVAAAAGLLTTLAFSLWPLAAIGRVSPGALFREPTAPRRRMIPPMAASATALAATLLAALIVLTAPDRGVAAWYVVGAVAALVLFRAAGIAIERGARALGRIRRIAARPILRLALANLHRPGAPTGRAVISLGIGLTVLVAIALVEGNLAREIDTNLAEHAPEYFVIDIQPGQLAGLGATVGGVPGASFDQVPMLRARITKLNGVPVEQAKIAAQAQWALRSDRGLTYSATLPKGSSLDSGKWWPPDYHGPPLISFDAELARGMGLKVGDTLTVNLLGREITATIANLRRIDWTRLGINFAIVFAPGTLEAAPQTHLAALYGTPAAAETAVRKLADQFPNLSAIPVRETLAAVAHIIATIADAMRLVALVTVLAGILVLGGAIAAGHRRRVYEAVVLKVLGATRGTVTAAFLIEHVLVGAAAALAAGIIGTVAAFVVVTGPMRSEWVFLIRPLVLVLPLGVVVSVAIGYAGTWRALGAKPAAFLRNE